RRRGPRLRPDRRGDHVAPVASAPDVSSLRPGAAAKSRVGSRWVRESCHGIQRWSGQDRKPSGRHVTMAERALRGTRLGATSYEHYRNTRRAPRQVIDFTCTKGFRFSVSLAAEAEVSVT